MNYMQEYQDKLGTSKEIAAEIMSGTHIFTDIALAEPTGIMDAIAQRCRAGSLSDLEIHTLLDVYPLPCYNPETADGIRGISWFSGASARKAVNAGIADIMPGHYSHFPDMLADRDDIDVFCVSVAHMDKHGYFSTSAVGSLCEVLSRKAKKIYLEINENLPRSLRGPVIHISQADRICVNKAPLPVSPPAVIDEISAAIGCLIADEIVDGATIQLGIGAIPEAVGVLLQDKRHLGIHTELFTDSMVALLECGAADNSRKPVHTGRSVAAFAWGSQRIYDYIDDNPGIELLPVDYVNDPAVIAMHDNFISVNSALEVDLYGQVCAESLGTRHVSGTGGQVDYVRGATHSKGGKSFIAFSSTAKGGTVSRIVPTLSPGAIVSTSKNDVDCIVTEYGIARLRGQSLSQRTKALIAIAHPKFRDELRFAAKKENILI